jgi:DNA-binding CsgD family transcriptional regulator
MHHTSNHLSLPHPKIYLLSDTEWIILIYLTNGLTSKDIAVHMNVMPKSVDNYKNRIGKKLGMQGYGVLYKYAADNRTMLY